MSVVAVRVTNDEIIIGADSILVTGYTQTKDKAAKLFETNGLIVGDVGFAQEGSLFFLYCQTRKPTAPTELAVVEFMVEFGKWKDTKGDELSIQNSYILIFEEKAFIVEGLFVKEITDFTAIGAGMDYALSALYLGETVERAIEVACELSIYCERPINIKKVKKTNIKKKK